MIIFAFLILTIYLMFAVWLLTGLRKAATQNDTLRKNSEFSFSVIIAAHNEAEVIGETLNRLAVQDYPTDRFEVIVAADRCTDETVKIVNEKKELFKNLELLEIERVPSDISPKKYALGQGISKARFDDFILMDADCFCEPEYLKTFAAFRAAGIELIVNIPKIITKNLLLHRYLAAERLVTWSIAAAGVGHREPFLAFGGSWAYTRDLFQRAGGLNKISGSLSGDDDLLIYRMGKLTPNMAVNLYPEGWVQTSVPGNLNEFSIQRRRHHSAGKFYAPAVQAGYAIFHLSHFALWILPLIHPIASIALGIKFFSDFLVLKYSGRIFREKISPGSFILFEFGYLLQHLLIAPLGFLGKIKWR